MSILKEPNFRVVRKAEADYRKGEFRLTRPMRYLWRSKQCVVTIPEGTRTDFASIHGVLRAVTPVNGAHRLPAVLHDYLYANAGVIVASPISDHDDYRKPLDSDTEIRYSRSDADDEFKRAMIAEGVSKWRAYSMHKAVAVFGGLYLRKIKKIRWVNEESDT